MTITSAPIMPTKEAIYFYFMDLPDAQRVELEDFNDHWAQIRHFQFNPNQLSAILFKVSRAAKRKTALCRTSLHEWEKQALPQLHHFDSRGLANTILAFATLKRIPSDDFMLKLFDVVRDKMYNFNARDISQILQGLTKLRLLPDDSFMQLWSDTIKPLSQHMSPEDCARTLYALAIFDSLDPYEGFKDLASYFNHALGSTYGDIKIRSMTYDARLWFGFPQIFSRPNETPSNSLFEGRLLDNFRINGLDISKGFSSEALPHHHFDFYAGQRKTEIMIELDGAHHFNRTSVNERYFDGSTMFQSALIQALHPTSALVRITPSAGDFLIENLSYEGTRKVFRDFLDAASAKPGRFFVPDLEEDGTMSAKPLFPDWLFEEQQRLRWPLMAVK